MDKQAKANVEASRKAAVEQEAKSVAENSGLKPLSASERADAQKEGQKEAIKEAAKDTYQYLTDGNLPGDPPKRQFVGHDDIMQWEPLLSLGIDAFVERIKEGGEPNVPEEKVYGLLALERNGQNRTDYVRAMMKRLDLKADELPGGGPDYTNDTTPISKL